MSYQAFFFDFDGVLADSVHVKTRAFARLFEHYGMEIVEKVIQHHTEHGGMSRFEKFRFYYSRFIGEPLSDDRMKELCQSFSNLVIDEVVSAREIPGAEKFVKKCKERGPCFIISGTPEKEMREIARRRGISRFFREILGSPTSKKENLGRILHHYGFSPEKCVFFGDATSDYEASAACNVQFVGIVPDGSCSALLKAYPGIRWYPDFMNMPDFSSLRISQ